MSSSGTRPAPTQMLAEVMSHMRSHGSRWFLWGLLGASVLIMFT